MLISWKTYSSWYKWCSCIPYRHRYRIVQKGLVLFVFNWFYNLDALHLLLICFLYFSLLKHIGYSPYHIRLICLTSPFFLVVLVTLLLVYDIRVIIGSFYFARLYNALQIPLCNLVVGRAMIKLKFICLCYALSSDFCAKWHWFY